MKFIKLFENFIQSINSVNDLMNYLTKFNVDFSSWGTGKSKTINELFDEIVNKDCRLEEHSEYLIRLIEFVGVKIYYRKGEDVWFLKEDRQEFNDGRVRRRNLPSSVAEKMISGESPIVAAIRGIKEELGVEISSSQLTKKRDINYNGSSMSYPGLRTKYKGYGFTCFFTDAEFKESGYVEIQNTKKTYFKWVKIS